MCISLICLLTFNWTDYYKFVQTVVLQSYNDISPSSYSFSAINHLCERKTSSICKVLPE